MCTANPPSPYTLLIYLVRGAADDIGDEVLAVGTHDLAARRDLFSRRRLGLAHQSVCTSDSHRPAAARVQRRCHNDTGHNMGHHYIHRLAAARMQVCCHNCIGFNYIHHYYIHRLGATRMQRRCHNDTGRNYI